MQKTKPVARLEHALTFGNIWLSALSLMKSGKVYAYALPSRVKAKFGFEPSKLMTYFVLYKLEDEGLICAAFQGRRKYYELTSKGRQSLSIAKKLLASLSRRL